MPVYARSAEIIRRIKLEMPVSITLEDPFTHQPFTIHRENVLSLLVLDTENLLLEEQANAPLYVEFARAQRAAEYAAAKAEHAYAKWKAERAEELYKKAGKKKKGEEGEEGATGKVTEKMIETAYRTHADYEKYALAKAHFDSIAGLFSDIKEGFRLKSHAMGDTTKMIAGHEQTLRSSDSIDRMAEIEQIEQTIDQSSSAAAAEAIAADVKKNGADKGTRKARDL